MPVEINVEVARQKKNKIGKHRVGKVGGMSTAEEGDRVMDE
jgi:hypothetical protein